jgi:hypothetical protein
MQKTTLAAALLALTAGIAQAQTNPGLAHLAGLAGVSPDGFTQPQLIQLIEAQRDGDDDTVAFILSQRGADVGRADAAAAIAQDAYKKAMDARTANLVENLSYAERAYKNVANAAKEMWDAAWGFGRTESLDSQIAVLNKWISNEGCLMFSLVLKRSLSQTKKPAMIQYLVALAIVESLKRKYVNLLIH